MDDKTKTPAAENEKDRNAELSDGDLDKVSGGDHGPRLGGSLYWDPASRTYVPYNPHVQSRS